MACAGPVPMPLILGGAGFSYQLHPDPASLPALEIVKRAFQLGLRACDTSPYYEPSEQLLGAALSHPDIKDKYARSEYFIMTKSVLRSLKRFSTSYLDVVFCHDVEFVTVDQALKALGALFDFVIVGKVRYVGISGYDLERLATAAEKCRERYGRPVDVVQNWAQLSLQNTKLEQYGIPAFRKAGVRAVCNSSPLAVGLLRAGGVPVGSLGDWRPAPAGLREAAQQAADEVGNHGANLAALGLRYAIARAVMKSDQDFTVATITGVGSMSDLEQNIETANEILATPLGYATAQGSLEDQPIPNLRRLDGARIAADEPLIKVVRKILGKWVDYDFSTKQLHERRDAELPKAKLANAVVDGVSSRL